MYILKNAVISITRNKSRNILIGIIILVISCTTAITLAIKNSSSELIASYASKYDVVASIGINRESMMGSFKPKDSEDNKENMREKYASISNLTVDQIKKYGDSDYVKSYYYSISMGVNSSLEPASATSNNGNMPKDIPGRGGGIGKGFTNQTSGDFTLTGYSSYEAMNEFLSGNYSIISGEIFEDFESSSCVINSELATLNSIEVGDTITIKDAEDASLTYKLKVTGIYEEKSGTDNTNNMSMFANSVNNIITNTSFVSTMVNKNDELTSVITPSFVLKSKDVIDEFEAELKDKGLNEYLMVTTNLEQIEGATSTISNVSSFATTFLIITLIIGAIVLFVINMINIRERKYEIGVLRTIGMKKSLLTLQFLSELLIVSVISLFIGAGIGACLSVPVSNSLLKSEVEESKNQINDVQKNFGRGNEDKRFERVNGVAQIQAYDSIDAVVDIKVLGQLLAIGIILTLVSGSASMISIQKFSPLTILKERT